MLITGEQDSNVPALNSREMYYALRRLDKEVVWVNYIHYIHYIHYINGGPRWRRRQRGRFPRHAHAHDRVV